MKKSIKAVRHHQPFVLITRMVSAMLMSFVDKSAEPSRNGANTVARLNEEGQ